MRKAGLEDEVTTFDVADSTHSLAENVHVRVWRGGRRQIANTRRLDGLLRPRRERPRSHRAADERDELAPSHVGHGGGLPPLCAKHGCTFGSPRTQGITERTPGPWATPEMF